MAKVTITLEDSPDGIGFTMQSRWLPDINEATTTEGMSHAQKSAALALAFIHRLYDKNGSLCDCPNCQARTARN